MRQLTTLFTLLASIALQAQIPFTISEDFTSNHYGWYEGESNGGNAHIADGKMRIHFPSSGWVIGISPYVDPNRDFIMQCSFRQTAGPNDYGIGLVWGYNRKAGEYNYFMFSSNGYFNVSPGSSQRTASPPKQGIHEWIQSDAVRAIGQTNILKIEKKGITITYFLNGLKVSSTEVFNWTGKEIGITADAGMDVEFDDFSFAQEGLKINLPPNLASGQRKENMGPNINTEADDLIPRISADGKSIYFGRENYTGNIAGVDDGEDFYVSHWDGTQWGPAQNMGEPVNSRDVDNILSVSTDENTLLFVYDSKFWSRSRKGNGWGEPREIGISYENVAKHFEACLSPDGKTILLTIQNKNNVLFNPDIEEKDIYYSLQDENGNWSVPVNCGQSLNTPGNEVGPFLAADGRTLYFSTNGRPGYGGNDIYMSKRIGAGWTQWSEPVNLGPEINTPGFDAYYVVPASGDYAYMASNQGGLGGTDIVRIKIAKEIKPDPVVLVHGRVLDAKSGKAIQGDVLIDNLALRKEVGEATSDPASGEFTIVLPYGYNYGFRAAAPGYLSVNENLDLTSISSYTEVRKDLLLVPIRAGEVIQLNNVFFEQGKPALKPESYVELNRLVQIMKDNPNMEIELSGHTDNIGNPIRLTALSQDRVGAVKKYMVDQGIAGSRITGRGYGSSRPVEKNDTEEHRRMNRRVEFKIVRN